MKTFSGTTANQLWVKAHKFCQKGNFKTQQSRAGETEELLHVGFDLKNPRQKWILARQPGINPAFALAEVIWIMNGCDESRIVNYWNPMLPKFQGKGKRYYGAYGFRIKKNFGIDQFERVCEILKNEPDSRQVVLQIWDPNLDLPLDTGERRAEDIPCNVCSLLKVRDSKLEWMQIMRSNDLFRGFPHNIVQFTSIQEILAGWIGVEIGNYIHIADSLHFYRKDFQEMTLLNDKVPKNKDNLSIPKLESQDLLKFIFQKMNEMIESDFKEEELAKTIQEGLLNESYKNILLIISADVARRRGWFELLEVIIEMCTNDTYKLIWKFWNQRFPMNK